MQRLQVWVLPFAVSFFFTTALTALLIRIAPGRRWVSLPRQDRWNERVVALFGGIPILLASSVATLFFFPARENIGMLLLTWGMALIGLTDDVAKLPPKAKLLGQAIMGGLALYAGIVLPLTSHFWINAGITMFWIVGITNALNLLDNMDGVAAGVAVIAAAGVVLLAGAADPVRGVALCMLAAIAGFLVFNVNPAKVFMGDVGALSIGFFLACACIRTVQPRFSGSTALLVSCLILFVPLFDTLLVSVTRRMNGRPISLGARDHTSHRLVFLGLNERQAASLLWFMGAIAASMAFMMTHTWGRAGGIVALLFLGGVLFWVYLAKVDLPSAWLSPGLGRVAPIPKRLQETIAVVFFRLVDASAVTLAIYLAQFQRPDFGLQSGFLFTAALALAIKMPVLIVFSATGWKWSMGARRDAYPLLICAGLGVLLLAAAPGVLPRFKALAPSVIFLDAIFTFSLLMLCRGSSRILDALLRRQKTLAVPTAQRASRKRAEPAAGGTIRPADQRISENVTPDLELNRRSN